jgi:hypothetical protein
MRQGFYAAGDGGAAIYKYLSTPCTLNSGNGDNGSQVKAPDGGCWVGELGLPGGVNVQVWGAKGDGSTGDGAAINAATAYVGSIGGGTVLLPPTGAAYVVDHGITVPAGVHLQGAGGLNWTSPIDNTESHWTNKSTWLHCTDTVNPCVDITGSSAAVEGINFWYTQPTPATTAHCGNPCTFVSYAWTTFPYTIKVEPGAGVGVWINNDSIVNASHCVDWEGPGGGVSGVYSGMDRDNFGCFNVGTRFHFIDNTLNLSRLRYEMWWYQGTAQIWYAMQGAGSHVDWDMSYIANPQVNDVEFTFSGTAMKFTDDTVVSGFGPVTFGVSHMQAKGVSFNEVCQAMVVADGTCSGCTAATAHVSGRLTNTILYTDSSTSPVAGQCARARGYAIDLSSDGAQVYFDGLDAGYVQSLAHIGGGTSSGAHGQLYINNVTVQKYSAYAAGAPGVATDATGSYVEFNGTPLFYPNTAAGGGVDAGPLCSGNCSSATQHISAMVSGLELAAVGGVKSSLLFSNVKTPPSIGYYLGTPAWDWRNDPGGTFFLDRYDANGGFIDTPFYVVPSGTGGPNQTQTQITGEAVLHGGAYLVPIPINQLPACGPTDAGLLQVLSNGDCTTGRYNTTVSAPGNCGALVICNNTNWVYQ